MPAGHLAKPLILIAHLLELKGLNLLNRLKSLNDEIEQCALLRIGIGESRAEGLVAQAFTQMTQGFAH